MPEQRKTRRMGKRTPSAARVDRAALLLTRLQERVGGTKTDVRSRLARELGQRPPTPQGTLNSWERQLRAGKPLPWDVVDAIARVLGDGDEPLGHDVLEERYGLRADRKRRYVRAAEQGASAAERVQNQLLEVDAAYAETVVNLRMVARTTREAVYPLTAGQVWVATTLSEPFLAAVIGDRELLAKRLRAIREGALILYLLPSDALISRLANARLDRSIAFVREGVEQNLQHFTKLRDAYLQRIEDRQTRQEAERHFDTHVQCWRVDEMPLTPFGFTVNLLYTQGDAYTPAAERMVMRYPVRHEEKLRFLPSAEHSVLAPHFKHFVYSVAAAHRAKGGVCEQFVDRLFKTMQHVLSHSS